MTSFIYRETKSGKIHGHNFEKTNCIDLMLFFDEIFQKFDEIVDNHGLHRIKNVDSL